MGKRPFLLLYINDFLGSPVIQEMSDSQVRWYLYLLMRAWQNEPACHLPNDHEQLRILAGCKSTKQWAKQKSLVLSQFDVSDTKNHITNARLIAEYERICKISDTKRVASNKRWNKKMHMDSGCNAETMHGDATSLTQTSLTSLTKPKSRTKPSPASGSDVRHMPVREYVEKCCTYAKVPFTWEGAEAKALSSFLKGNPSMAVESVIELVKARFRSKDPPGDRPRIWIGNLGRYASERVNGNGQSKQDERTTKSREAITRVLSPLVGRDRPVPQDGSERLDGESLVGRPQPLLRGSDS